MFGTLLVSPSMVQTVGLADCTGLHNPHSCHYRGTNPGFDFLLASLTWFKPGERLSLANRWMCQYPYDKNTGVRTMVQTGGKVTCCNRGVRYNHVSQPRGVRYNRELQPLVSELDVHVVVLLGGECMQPLG